MQPIHRRRLWLQVVATQISKIQSFQYTVTSSVQPECVIIHWHHANHSTCNSMEMKSQTNTCPFLQKSHLSKVVQHQSWNWKTKVVSH